MWPSLGQNEDSDPLQPQLINELDDVVRPVSHAAPRLVVLQPQTGSIDADQADTGADRGFGDKACLKTGPGMAMEILTSYREDGDDHANAREPQMN
jgi:hypothetical protein